LSNGEFKKIKESMSESKCDEKRDQLALEKLGFGRVETWLSTAVGSGELVKCSIIKGKWSLPCGSSRGVQERDQFRVLVETVMSTAVLGNGGRFRCVGALVLRIFRFQLLMEEKTLLPR